MALVERMKLDPGSDEYQEVARRFNSRYMVEGMKCELLGVERVYNESLEQRFAERRQQYQKMYGHVDIKKGWHGTKEENVASILENNFDVSKNAVRRHRYGAGVSFSSLPSYASYYCDKTSEASMLLADVLVSNAVAVAENKGRLVRAPPLLPGSTLHYDTTAKSLDRMDVFVKSDKDAFLPTHVVRFRRGDSEPRDAATPARHHADLSHSLASLALAPPDHDHGRQSDWDHCDGLFDYGAEDDFICDLSDDNMSDYYGEDYEDCDYLSDYGVEDHEDCDRDSDNGDEGYNCESDHVFTLSDETWQVAPNSHGVNLSDQGDEENNYAYVDGYSDDGDEGYNYACGPVDDFSYPGDQDGPFHYDLDDADDHGNQDGTFGDLDFSYPGDQEALYDDHDPVCEGGDLGDVHDPGYQDDPYDVFGDVHDPEYQNAPFDVLGDVHDAGYQDDHYDVLGDVHDAGYQDDHYDVLGDVHDAGYQDDPYDVLGDVHDPGNGDFFDDY